MRSVRVDFSATVSEREGKDAPGLQLELGKGEDNFHGQFVLDAVLRPEVRLTCLKLARSSGQ